ASTAHAPKMLSRHVLAPATLRQADTPVALEVEDLARLLDQIVEHPLLAVARERRSAAYHGPGACHPDDPPSRCVPRSSAVAVRSPSLSSRGNTSAAKYGNSRR